MKEKKKVLILLSVFLVIIMIITIPVIHHKNKYDDFKKCEQQYQNQINNSVKATVEYNGIMDYDEYEYFLTHVNNVEEISEHSIPKEYNKHIRFNITLENNTIHSLSGFIVEYFDENFYITPECIDFEPTRNIVPKSKVSADILVYVNENLRSDDDIEKALKKINLTVLFYIENKDNSLDPFKVTVIGSFE